jgi:hypothetical protein
MAKMVFILLLLLLYITHISRDPISILNNRLPGSIKQITAHWEH